MVQRLEGHRAAKIDAHEIEEVLPKALPRIPVEVRGATALRNEEILEFVARQAQPALGRGAMVERQSSGAPGPNDRILYVGMNAPSTNAEVAALRSSGAGVEVVAHSKEWDRVALGGKTFNLQDDGEAKAFALALGLPENVASNVAHVLAHGNGDEKVPVGSRDELAGIVTQWAAAERGIGSAPSRLVLSGHSTGDSVFGTDELRFDDVKALARAMPRAAAFVEDLHLAGCNTGKNGSANMERAQLLEAFPNLRTIWGYQGSSPLAPVSHLSSWEAQTRGVGTPHPTSAMLEQGAVAADRFGHVDSKASRMPMSELLVKLADADKWFEHYFNGWLESAPGPSSRLYDDYQLFQVALSRPDMPEAAKAPYQTKSDQAVRLRFYAEVRTRFQEHYAKEIAEGFVGAGAPDFSKLSRKDALAVIDGYFAKNPTGKLAPMLLGLKNLDPAVIPLTWCH